MSNVPSVLLWLCGVELVGNGILFTCYIGASYCLAFNSEATSQGACQDYHRQKQNSKAQTHKHMLGVAQSPDMQGNISICMIQRMKYMQKQ